MKNSVIELAPVTVVEALLSNSVDTVAADRLTFWLRALAGLRATR